MELGAMTRCSSGCASATDPDRVRGDHRAADEQCYIRPGGLATDLPEDGEQRVAELLKILPGRAERTRRPADRELHLEGSAPRRCYLDLTGCMALG